MSASTTTLSTPRALRISGLHHHSHLGSRASRCWGTDLLTGGADEWAVGDKSNNVGRACERDCAHGTRVARIARARACDGVARAVPVAFARTRHGGRRHGGRNGG